MALVDGFSLDELSLELVYTNQILNALSYVGVAASEGGFSLIDGFQKVLFGEREVILAEGFLSSLAVCLPLRPTCPQALNYGREKYPDYDLANTIPFHSAPLAHNQIDMIKKIVQLPFSKYFRAIPLG